jgi:hypothetical protein
LSSPNYVAYKKQFSLSNWVACSETVFVVELCG